MIGKTRREIKQNKPLQRIIRFINYYVSLGIIGTIINHIIQVDNSVMDFLIEIINILSILYPPRFAIILSEAIVILNFFILNFSNKNIMIITSVALNTGVISVFLLVRLTHFFLGHKSC